MGSLLCCHQKEPQHLLDIKDRLNQIVDGYQKKELKCKYIGIYSMNDDNSRDIEKLIDLEDLIEKKESEQQPLMKNVDKNLKNELNAQTIGSLHQTTEKLLHILKDAKLLQKMASSSKNKTVHIKGDKSTLFSYYLISDKYCCVAYIQSNELRKINYSEINDINKRHLGAITDLLTESDL